jgi:hypothetical protein
MAYSGNLSIDRRGQSVYCPQMAQDLAELIGECNPALDDI